VLQPQHELGAVSAFAPALVRWQRQSGRHGLPWQATRDPYRVWLSEVMLQQTQVGTVLAYYPRFLDRFPDVQALAAASEDEVLALWSGLGYYSRARNLHRCAQVVVQQHAGRFPATAAQLQLLPGIGASTAAAIAAFCHGERISILDGNVRRVLTRLLAFDGDLAQAGPQRALWAMAQSMLPSADRAQADMAAYTQGLMDLGATVCTRSRPQCERCPVQDQCRAAALGTPTAFPVKTRRLQRRHESWWLWLWRTQSASGEPLVWLERRPSTGIWAGLYAPVVTQSPDAPDAAPLAADAVGAWQEHPAFAHSLTHRELRLHPCSQVLTPPEASAGSAIEAPAGRAGQWVALSDMARWGLPAPVRQWLMQLLPSDGATGFRRT